MDEFKELIDVVDALLGPNGCPWDQEQTMFTLQVYSLEELYELIEAIDENDPLKIKEELGDCFFNLIFIAKIGEKNNQFTLSDALRSIVEKLIRRHPHVFGNTQVSGTEEVLKNWDKIKKAEGKKNPLEGIPKNLPALSRAQKVISRLKRASALSSKKSSLHSEKELGNRLWEILQEAESSGFDAENVLRRFCKTKEEEFDRL